MVTNFSKFSHTKVPNLSMHIYDTVKIKTLKTIQFAIHTSRCPTEIKAYNFMANFPKQNS
jgi:hypothetical protein